MNITIKTFDALTTVKSNKQNHIDTFVETVEGWKVKHKEFTDSLSVWALNEGGNKERPQEPQKPKDHTDEYDRLIELLETHVLDNIEVAEYEYDEIIKNKFGWSEGFMLSNSQYTSR